MLQIIKTAIKALSRAKNEGDLILELAGQNRSPELYKLKKSCIVYGPPASGKTKNAKALKNYFKMKFIIDDDEFDISTIPLFNCLVLTNRDLSGRESRYFDIIPIKKALKKAGIK